MNTPRYAAAVAKLLAKHLPQASTSGADVGHERGVATIEQAMQVRALRRQRTAVLGGLAAVAMVAAAAVLLRGSLGSQTDGSAVPINVVASGQGVSIHAVETDRVSPVQNGLVSGQRIETPVDGNASLALATGTLMTLSGSTSFRVDSQGTVERFSLQGGEMRAHVAKLGAGRRFIVATPDAEVEVRGTKFRLQVLGAAEACDAATRTRLDVTEGVVEVRASGQVVSVKAGEFWPARCRPELAEQRPSDNAGLAAPAHGQTPPAGGVASRPLLGHGVAPHAAEPTASSARDSRLAAQNDLFAEGVARRRLGDVSGALRAYDEVVRRFPASPLAENAIVERMRLLTGTSAGRAEAQRYLARYPRGFAAVEARRLAAEP